MNAFDQLHALPELRRLFDLVWRLFGVNVTLVAPDGRREASFDPAARTQPFCAALHSYPGGSELCARCDQSKFLEVRREGKGLRYRCHAGLRMFIIPMIRGGQIIAQLKCGQVHDRAPSAAEWQEARQSLLGAGIRVAPELRALFQRNRVLTADQQNDLVDLLELIAVRLAHADEREIRVVPDHTQAALDRATTFIESNLTDRIRLASVARVANLSIRSLTRLFRKEVGTSVVDYILQRRVALARQLLRQPDRPCAEIAFECGFGSVQHFNRLFRRFEHTSPTAWRVTAHILAQPVDDLSAHVLLKK